MSMEDNFVGTRAVSESHQFDVAALATWLGAHLPGFKGPLQVDVKASAATKCDRCWHYCDDVGKHPEHPMLCGRCISNLHGTGEVRHFA